MEAFEKLPDDIEVGYQGKPLLLDFKIMSNEDCYENFTNNFKTTGKRFKTQITRNLYNGVTDQVVCYTPIYDKNIVKDTQKILPCEGWFDNDCGIL